MSQDADLEPRIWDRGLQPERTALAWQRVGLSLLGCSLVLAAIDKNRIHLSWLVPTLVVMGLALWIVVRGQTRYHRAHRYLVHEDGRLPSGRLPLTLASAVFLLGVVAFATWVSGLG